MHTIKITPNLLFEYQCTSGKFIRLPNRIESNRNFFCPNWNALVESSGPTAAHSLTEAQMRDTERERGGARQFIARHTDRQTDSRPAGRCCMLLWTVPVDLLFTTTLPRRLPSEYSTSTDRLLGDLATPNRLFIHLQYISYTNKSKRVQHSRRKRSYSNHWA